MATISFTDGTSNVTTKIIKEDKNNTDILTINAPLTTIIDVNDTVEYYDKDSTLIFKGIVQNVKQGQDKEVLVYDLGAELLQRTVNEIFNNKKPEEIIEDIINDYTSLTYVSTISSSNTITTYVANKKRAWDIVVEMAELLLANFSVDVNGNLTLELEGANTSSKSITISNAVLDGKWVQDITQLYNSVTVDGDDRQIFERDPELFNGTGSQTEFTLAEIPVDIKVEHPVGTVLTGYVSGSSTGDYTIDRENKNVTFDTAPSSDTNNVQITYTSSIPISVRRRDSASVTAYGQRDKVYKKPYIKSRTEAREFANYILENFKDPLLSSNWIMTSVSDFNDFVSFLPNDTINITDSIRNISGDFIIRKVERNNNGVLKIKAGQLDDDYVSWSKESQQRIKQLEEKDDNATILSEDELLSENLKLQWDIDLIDIKQRTYDADQFYWSETSTTRNQFKEDGTGPLFREVGPGNGYTESDLLGTDERVTSNSTDTRVTSNSTDIRITSGLGTSFTTSAVVPTAFQNTAISNLITELNTTITHLAVGDDNTAPVEGDTALGNETDREALFGTSTTSNNISFEIFLDTTENNGNSIEEAGILDAGAGGNLYQRGLTNVIAKTASIEVFVTVSINITGGVNTSLN